MTEGRANLSGAGSQTIYINTYWTGRSQGANTNSYRSYGIYEGNNYGSWTNAPQSWSANLGGVALSGTFTIPFASRNGSITLYDYPWNRTADANGYGSDFYSSFSVSTDHTNIGSGTVTVYEGVPPRIPKPPGAPTTLGIDQITADSFRYRFQGTDEGGTPVREWQIQVATNSAFTTGVEYFTSTGTTTIPNRANHTQYWARGRGRNDIDWGPFSASSTGTTLGHPSAPTSVSAVASTSVTGRVTITWSAPATTGAGGITGYNVFRDGVQIATITGTTTTHTDNSRTPFTSYSYRIAARNDYSNSVSGMGPQSSASVVTAQGPPSAVLSLSGASHSTIPGRVDLTWSAPTNTGTGGITGYRVRLADGTLLLNQNGTTTSASITGLLPGTTYTFKVSGRNALSDTEGSEGAFSNQLTLTPIGEPAAPTAAAVIQSVTTSNRLVLSWTAPSGTLSGYNIFSQAGGVDTLIATIGSGHTSYAIDNLTAGTSYTYVVRARTAYTDTLAPGYPGSWGGPASSAVTATATVDNTQTVPSVAAITSVTNAVFNGTYIINSITPNTLSYAKTGANIASSTSGGSIVDNTNATFNGTYAIASATASAFTYAKTASNIGLLLVGGGTVTDSTNVGLNGTVTVTAVNVGANLVSYASSGADISSRSVPINAAPGGFGQITNLSNAIFNGTGKVITAITEYTIKYAQTNANVAESNAAGKVINATNRDIFNGTYILSSIPAYNKVIYARTASNIALRTWISPNGLLHRKTSPATLDFKFRSGWSG